MVESNEDMGDRMYILVMVALVILDQPGGTLLLGNNIGEHLNWTIRNSKYFLFQ